MNRSRSALTSSTDADLRNRDVSLRRLATFLVGNAEDAEDAVQDTWLAALQQPAHRVQNPTGWLRRVVRHRVLHLRREDALRTQREQRAAESLATEEVDLAAPRLAEADLKSELARSLSELGDPYREVLLARFDQDLSIHEIARQLDRPTATVKSQINRGLRKMREILDRRSGGDRDRWLVPLLLLVPKDARPPTAPVPASATPIRLILGGSALGVASLGVLLGTSRPPEPTTDRRSPGTEVAEHVVAPATDRGEERLGPVIATNETVEIPTVGRLARVDGIVLDDDRRVQVPDAEIWVAAAGHPELARRVTLADELGRFQLAELSTDTWIAAQRDGWVQMGWVSLATPEFLGDSRRQLVLRIARATTLQGTVVDTAGNPIPAVELEVTGRRDQRPWYHLNSFWRFPSALDSARSDAAGRYAIEAHPRLTQTITVRAEGYAPLRVPLESGADLVPPGTIQMTRGGSLSGRIESVDGRVTAAGWIEFESSRGDLTTAVAGEDGAFEIVNLAPGPGTLRVRGTGSDRDRSHRSTVAIEEGRTTRLAIRLNTSATVRGRAVDESGNPLAGWSVRRRPAADSNRPDRLQLRVAARDELAMTAEDGSFSFGACPVDACRLYLFAPDGGHPRATAVAEPSRTVVLTALPNDASLRGRLPKAYDGHAFVVLRSDQLLSDEYATVGPDRPGFEFEGLPRGRYELQLWESGGQPTPLRTLELSDSPHVVGEVRPAPPGALCVDVRDPSGGSIRPNAVMLLKHPEGEIISRSGTNAGDFGYGPVLTDHVTPGWYRLAVIARGYAADSRLIAIEPGQVLPIEVKMQPGAFAMLELVTPNDFAMGRFTAEIRTEDGQLASRFGPLKYQPVSEKVRVRLPYGRYEATIETDSGHGGSAEFEVSRKAPGRPTKIRVEPNSSGGR